MELWCDYPRKTKTISLTGAQCALNCAHCGKKYLRQMTPIAEIAAQLDGDTLPIAPSYLISGGCDAQGRVPVTAHLDTIAKLRECNPPAKFLWHVGLIDAADMATIAPYTDLISYDFIGDDATIREVYHMPRTVDDFIASYRVLRAHAAVFPHLTIGLRGGIISGEYRAIDILQNEGLDALVLLVLIPTAGTQYANREPPPLSEVAKLITYARRAFPDKPLILGCMRPYGDYRREVDKLAIRLGVNRIVNPTRAALEYARERGMIIRSAEECCVVGLTRLTAPTSGAA